MNTFKNTQYTITTSLNERTIYIKIANNISYMCYEGNFGAEAFNGPFKLDEAYALINKCFETMDGVDFELNCKILLVKFKVVVLGVFNLAFELRLKELVIAEDGRLSTIVEELRGNILVLSAELELEKQKRDDLERTVNELVVETTELTMWLGGYNKDETNESFYATVKRMHSEIGIALKQILVLTDRMNKLENLKSNGVIGKPNIEKQTNVGGKHKKTHKEDLQEELTLTEVFVDDVLYYQDVDGDGGWYDTRFNKIKSPV